jgi:hypothetical protein
VLQEFTQKFSPSQQAPNSQTDRCFLKRNWTHHFAWSVEEEEKILCTAPSSLFPWMKQCSVSPCLTSNFELLHISEKYRRWPHSTSTAPVCISISSRIGRIFSYDQADFWSVRTYQRWSWSESNYTSRRWLTNRGFTVTDFSTSQLSGSLGSGNAESKLFFSRQY